jgi:hypothetical protein
VPAGDARGGRRDNGLVAAEYAVAGDVDPRLGEHLLDVLALQGIAAYLRPSTDLHPVTRTTTLPDRPTDRLYVDRTHLEAARGYLDRLRAEESRGEVTTMADGPPRGGDDMEAAWAAIVAGYHDDRAAGAWPASEDVARDSGRDGGRDPDEPRGAGTQAPRRLVDGRAALGDEPPSLLDGLDTFGANLPDDDEGYEPPPPPPLPRPSMPTVLATLAIAVGFLLLLWPGLLPVGHDVVLLLGFGGIIAGFVTLVWRLRPGDEDDDVDPDDGAKV